MSSPRLVYQQGDHVCTLYETPQQQLSAATEYIRGGIARNERCLYVCVEHDKPTFRRALQQAGIEVGPHEKRGSLVLVDKHEGHLEGGTFAPKKMITMLKRAVEDALAAGFNGLCAAGDMSWILDDAPGTEKLAEYEALLNHFFDSHRALGLCLYNRCTLPGHALDHSLATHRHVRVERGILLENPFYELPEIAAKRPPTGTTSDVDAKIRTLTGLHAIGSGR